MAIDINKSTTRVDPPDVTLRGQLIDTTTGVYRATGNVAVTTQHIRSLNATNTEINHRAEKAFQGMVTVTLTADSDFTANSYSNRTTGTDIIGATAPTISNVNQKLETYYTINGKAPTRTKANLYTGPFTVRRNESGSDNFILKVCSYCNGLKSEVRTVEFRVARADTTKV